MARMEEVELTNMCMVCDGKGNVLVQNKKGDRTWHGWNFPGGHVEPGESLVRSVIREACEETGLTIEDPRLCGVKQWTEEDGSYRYLVFLFRAERFTGELRASDEGEVYWLPLSELQNRPLPSGFPEMLPLFLRDDLSETYHFLEDGEWRCENL